MEEFTYTPKFTVKLGSRQAKDIVSDYEDGTYFIPDTQREFSYNVLQKSAVIASIVRGLSIDTITLVQQSQDGDSYSICDGAHRVRVLKEFVRDGFALQVDSGGDNLCQLNGSFFGQLPKKLQAMIKRKEIQTVTVIPTEFDQKSITDAEVAVVVAKNSCAVKMSAAQKDVFRSASTNDDILFIKKCVAGATKSSFGGVSQVSAVSLALNSAGVNQAIGLALKYTRFVTACSRDEFEKRFDCAIHKETVSRIEKKTCGNPQSIALAIEISIFFALFSEGTDSSYRSIVDIVNDTVRFYRNGVMSRAAEIITAIQGRTKEELRFARLAKNDANTVFDTPKARSGFNRCKVRKNVYLTYGEMDSVKFRFGDACYEKILDELSNYKDENRIIDNAKTSRDYEYIMRSFGQQIEASFPVPSLKEMVDDIIRSENDRNNGEGLS